jgi:predicted transcriptional regulator
MREKKIGYFVVLGRSSTKKILEFLDEHDTVGYKELMQFATPFSLNRLLRELMNFDLIEYYYVNKDIKKEWYEITGKGKKILQCLKELEAILKK